MKHIFLTIVTLLTASVLSDAGTLNGRPTFSFDASGVIDERVERMLNKISRQKEQATDVELLHTIFRKTQKEFLHRYKQYAGLDELISGDFDCLTATSLFAAVLTKAGYTFRIIETNYHIFLLVSTSEGEVLLETTDRFRGFITSAEEIAKKIKDYRTQEPETSNEKAYSYNFQIFGEIEAAQLTGLLYFNQAVKAYNSGDWLSCSEKLVMADNHYASPRVTALASVLLYTISVGDLSDTIKQSIRSNLKAFDQSVFTSASK